MQLRGTRSPAFLAGALTFFGCVVFAAIARWLNANIGYANGFNCDSWYAFGIQLNFHEIHNWVQVHQLSRFPALVPWIFLGHKIPYETLNALKFFTYFAITCAGVLWFSTRLFGPKVAACVTVLFCCSTGFLGVLSHDYVTAAGLAWATLFVGATVEAGRARRPWPWGVAAGIFFGMGLYTHISIVLFVFAVPLLFLAESGHEAQIKGLALFLVECAAGFCMTTAACGLYNQSLGGSWFILGPEIRFALQLVKDSALNATQRVAGFTWMRTEATIVTIELGVLVSVAALFVNRSGLNARTTRVVAAVYLLTAAVTLGYEASGRILLQNNVYAPWIYPTLLAALGAALSQLKMVREMSPAALAGTLLVIVCVLLVAARTDVSDVSPDRLFMLKVVFGAAFVISLIALHRRRIGLVALLALAAFAAVNYPIGYGQFPWTPNSVSGRDMALQAAQALQKVEELHLPEIPVFWVDASRSETIAVPRSFVKCTDFAASFPSMTPGAGFESYFPPLTRAIIGSARTLLVVAPRDNLASIAAPRLRSIGLDSSSLGEWHIGSGALRNTMTLLRLTAATGVEPAASTAVFVGTDSTTQGNWVGRYGRNGYTVVNDAASYPSYAKVTVVAGTPYTWHPATSDSRALQQATGGGRLAAAWYGETLTLGVGLTDGAPHQVALYGVDWDTMVRDQRVDVLDAITGKVLDTRMLSGFHGGQYLVWTVRGSVSLVITRGPAANAVISGVFLDPPASAQSELSSR